MMMQLQGDELLLQSWPDYSSVDSSMEEFGLYFGEENAQLSNFEFSSSSMDDFSYADHDDSSQSHDLIVYGDHDESPPVVFPMDEVDTPLSDQFTVDELEGLCEWMASQEDVESLNLSTISSDHQESICVQSDQTSLVLPYKDMEIDDHLSILHLLKAYGEATELGQEDLSREIVRRLKEKACPIGATLERVAYHFIKVLEKQVDYLSTQSIKNYEAAFKAFYQIFPYGRFAHFAANSVILEAIPEDARVVHIVDFDIGKGIQWPPLIEELARRSSGNALFRLISIKWEEDHDCPSPNSFTETKKRLYEQARISGLRLKVEEMDMEGLASEMSKIKLRGRRNEWLSFNLMVDLPHMGTIRNVKHVIEFLKVAKDSINDHSVNFNGASRGIITVGNVIEAEKLMDSNGFESFFQGKLLQLQAFFESMEWHFPFHFTEARMAMESLFLAPQVSYLSGGSRKWEETATRESRDLEAIGLEAWRMSRDHVQEAKELVREGESLYWVSTEGDSENQLVLGYMGTPLVRFSSWT
ncbi:hypothetical protein Ddye_025108 [Dipteronia dyeriana]|uniref:Nodulation signaling pathway 2-like protein n=1 Tax=Dipteronia dyeriana TaxID=168575 RepID=A0AAD9TX45_9ROSI|nr:hypothetical protein Ddye_025108 [Dipteronia dyeriana]